ncbi:hypothetical protein Barb7_02242 [Bacteroidales bacterium Barb7]|nr:hypothetical protein Barb7_02242 [Bacteroidales bacterium Barb7]
MYEDTPYFGYGNGFGKLIFLVAQAADNNIHGSDRGLDTAVHSLIPVFLHPVVLRRVCSPVQHLGEEVYRQGFDALFVISFHRGNT